jgi:penicillin-binding protein 1A
MAAALKGQPPLPFRIPKGVRLVRVNSSTGKLAQPGERNVIFEAFKAGTEPKAETVFREPPVIGTSMVNTPATPTTPKTSTPPVGDVRGLY